MKIKEPAWLRIFYFENISKEELDYETKSAAGKDCPKYLVVINIECWRDLKQKVYVKKEAVKDFKVEIMIEKEMDGGFFQVSFPGEIPENRATKAVVLKKFISQNQ